MLYRKRLIRYTVTCERICDEIFLFAGNRHGADLAAGGKRTMKKKRILAVLFCLPLLTGCFHRPEPESPPAAEEKTAETELVPDEWSLENLLEPETDLLYMTSIWEAEDEKTAEWGRSFDVNDVQKVIYLSQGETVHEYEMTESADIQAFFDAIDEIEVGGEVEGRVGDAGDQITFIMKDGQEYMFAFEMGSLLLDDKKYETDDADTLWSLTSQLLLQDL